MPVGTTDDVAQRQLFIEGGDGVLQKELVEVGHGGGKEESEQKSEQLELEVLFVLYAKTVAIWWQTLGVRAQGQIETSV